MRSLFLLIYAAIALYTPAKAKPEVTNADRDFLRSVLAAVNSGDTNWIAAHTDLPVVVHQGKTQMTISKQADFAAILQHHLTPRLIERINAAAAEPLFKNWQGAMLGDGIIWFEVTSSRPTGPWRYAIRAFGHFAYQPKSEIVAEFPDLPPRPESLDDAARAFYEREFTSTRTRLELDLPAGWAPGTRAFIEFTAKSHGMLQIGKFTLRVFDNNADPICYKNDCLRLAFLMAEDGTRLISISGNVRRYCENGEFVLDEGELLLVYTYDPSTQHAQSITRSVPLESEDYLREKL